MTKSGSPVARSGPSPGSTAGSAYPKEGSKATNAPARPRGTRTIAIANQKGGVGKSTTAVSLGAALAETGRRVLVLDLDPQGNASTGLGIRHDAREVTVYDVVVGQAPIGEAIIQTPVPNLWAVPSTIDLAGAEIELVSQFSRELRLRKALEPLGEAIAYDYILLDCPPSLGLLTINALAAALELIVPIQCEYYALEGLGQLLRNVSLVQQNINQNLQLTGIVMTMFDPRTKLSEQVVEEVKRYFGDRVYDVIIPRTVRLSEAPGFGQPITVYDPRSKGAESYRRLAVEVDEKPPPSAPMPSMDMLPTAVASPQSGPKQAQAVKSTELEEVHAPAEGVSSATAPTAPEAPEVASPPPAPADEGPSPAEPVAPEQAAPEPEPEPAAREPAAHETEPPALESEPGPRSEGVEAASWLEALAFESHEGTGVTSSRILAEAMAEAEEELEEDGVWEEESTTAPEAPRPAARGLPPSDRRVVVIDEGTDIPLPEPPPRDREGEPQTGGARVGATLEDHGSRKRRWRLFRKGGE